MNWIEWSIALGLFWGLYVYLGYPLCLWLGAQVKNKKLSNIPLRSEESQPRVSVLIAAHNEVQTLPATLEALLLQKYPKSKMEILVTSDASDDGTDARVEQFCQLAAQEGVSCRLFRRNQREGKTAALNRMVKQAKGAFLVFADANSRFHPSALKELTVALKQPDVAYVTGRQLPMGEPGQAVVDGGGAFQRYEHRLRLLESQVGSVIGCDGGIDAMPKDLFTDLEPDQLPDFVLPIRLAGQGYRVAYAPTAFMSEPLSCSNDVEWQMRRRVALRGFWGLWDLRHLLNPLDFPQLAWQLWSHKLMRYLLPIPMFTVLLGSIVLFLQGSGFGAVLTICQALFYGQAFLVFVGKGRKGGIWSMPYYLCLVHGAFALAAFDFLRGKKLVTWKPRQG